MANPFQQTLRALEAERWFRPALAAAVLFAFIAAAAAWALNARVGVFVQSESALLQVEAESRSVQPAVSGSLTASSVSLGQTVEEGDLLFELDATQLQLQLQTHAAAAHTYQRQAAAIAEQIDAANEALLNLRAAAEAHRREARGLAGASQAVARQARIEARELGTLAKEGVAAPRDARRALAAAREGLATANAMRHAIARVVRDAAAAEAEHVVDLADLERRRVEVVGLVQLEQLAVARLEHQISQCEIRAPSSGRVAQVLPVRPGAFVEVGTLLATIVPRDRLRVVAEFRPAVAGRIRAGQAARIMLDGYPWVQYGVVPATVEAVANEATGNLLRVELSLAEEDTEISLQHGLPGTAEVEIDRVSPAQMLVRGAGEALTQDQPAADENLDPGDPQP